MPIIPAIKLNSTIYIFDDEKMRNTMLESDVKNMEKIEFDTDKKYDGYDIQEVQSKKTKAQKKKMQKDLNKVKVCAHLHKEDGKMDNIKVKIIKKNIDGTYNCSFEIPTGNMNKTITVYRGTNMVSMDAPKKCQHDGCGACSLEATFNI